MGRLAIRRVLAPLQLPNISQVSAGGQLLMSPQKAAWLSCRAKPMQRTSIQPYECSVGRRSYASTCASLAPISIATKRMIYRRSYSASSPRLAGGDRDRSYFSNPSPESLACLAVRLGLDFKASSWLDRASERTQVEHHMRMCLAASDGFRTMVTISPSEPLLAEASAAVMRECLGEKEAPTALLQHISSSYLNAGDRGEIVVALLLLLARDKAVLGRKSLVHASPTDLKNNGMAQRRIVTVTKFLDALVPPNRQPFVREQTPTSCSAGHLPTTTLARAFRRAYIYFNHFIKVHNVKMVDRKFLWRLFCRGAAIICANNQRGVDLVIPVLMGTILDPIFITAIFIQVKNDARITDNLCIGLFDLMNPIEVGLFSKGSKGSGKHLPPVVRIAFAWPRRYQP